MDIQPLVGDVSVQLVWSPGSSSLEHAIEAARVDQEAMVGYPLKYKKHFATTPPGSGYVSEAFVTFEPA